MTTISRLLLCLAASFTLSVAHADDAAATTSSTSTSDTSSNGSLMTDGTHLLQHYVLGRNLQLGVGFAQENLTLSRAGDRAQMTDNGSAVLLASLSSSTTSLHDWNLRNGGAVALGYDFTATGSFFDMKDQLVSSAVAGSNVGTSVNGGFVAVEPRLSLSMGPLYAGSHVFWKYTLGAGPGVIRYNGTSSFYGDASSGTHDVSGNAVPVFYIENKWTTQIGHWDIIFNAQYMTGRHQGYGVVYQTYGAGIAYEFGL